MMIRAMRDQDLARVAELSAELGYPAVLSAFVTRFEQLARNGSGVLLVAERADALIGWIHAHPRWLLESDPFAEIGALVVAADARRSGVGRALVEAVADWARAEGFGRLRVRSNVARVESHVFYPSLGFARLKTQHSYERSL